MPDVIFSAPGTFTPLDSPCHRDYLVLRHLLSPTSKNSNLSVHKGLPLICTFPECSAGSSRPHTRGLPEGNWAPQVKDMFALRLEPAGAAPDLFLGQQVQPLTDTKIHS